MGIQRLTVCPRCDRCHRLRATRRELCLSSQGDGPSRFPWV